MQAVVLLPAHKLCVGDRFAVTTLRSLPRALRLYTLRRRATTDRNVARLTTSESCERRSARSARERDHPLLVNMYGIRPRDAVIVN
jgi:hypothetical protein